MTDANVGAGDNLTAAPSASISRPRIALVALLLGVVPPVVGLGSGPVLVALLAAAAPEIDVNSPGAVADDGSELAGEAAVAGFIAVPALVAAAAIAAVVTGIVAITRIRRDGSPGMWMPVTGLVFAVPTLLVAGYATLLFLWFLGYVD